MAVSRHADDALAGQVGQLIGLQQGQRDDLKRINEVLIAMKADVDARHKENMERIAVYHAENVKTIGDHQTDDNKNFLQVREMQSQLKELYNKAINRGVGALTVLTILWAALQFIAPYVFKH